MKSFYTGAVDPNWHYFLENERKQQYFEDLEHFIAKERSQYLVFPPPHEVFAAFNATPLSATKVVIVGQDPYHGQGQAHGLAFSVNHNVAIPPSLRNIFRECETDVGIMQPTHGDLSAWAHQGVLLLNTALTVRTGEANSHRGKGWEIFTDRVISFLSENTQSCVFVLWGANAQQKTQLIDSQKHFVITSAHPSPLSAHRGFLGSRPFSAINNYLIDTGQTPIKWGLP